MKTKSAVFVKRNIEHYFDFLLAKGWVIKEVDYAPQHFGNWKAILQLENRIIEIYYDRFELFVAFGSINSKSRIGLETMIYKISKGEVFIESFKGNWFWEKRKQFLRAANFLKEYIDKIMPFFGDDYKMYESDLFYEQAKFNNLAINKYAKKYSNIK